MQYNKIFNNTEYSTKQAICYFVMSYKNLKGSKELNLCNWVKELINIIEFTEENVLEKVDSIIYAEFPFYYSLNIEEILSFALVVFHRLLSYNNVIFEKDIVEELKITMRLYSSRTIFTEADNILSKLSKNKWYCQISDLKKINKSHNWDKSELLIFY